MQKEFSLLSCAGRSPLVESVSNLSSCTLSPSMLDVFQDRSLAHHGRLLQASAMYSRALLLISPTLAIVSRACILTNLRIFISDQCSVKSCASICRDSERFQIPTFIGLVMQSNNCRQPWMVKKLFSSRVSMDVAFNSMAIHHSVTQSVGLTTIWLHFGKLRDPPCVHFRVCTRPPSQSCGTASHSPKYLKPKQSHRDVNCQPQSKSMAQALSPERHFPL